MSNNYNRMDMNNSQEYEYVDLGLPSGTLWATCNVGASKPEDYGDYFAWGETKKKDVVYDWDTYKYATGNYGKFKLTKYCDRSDRGSNGFTDTLTELQPCDDPATANWGNGWGMPSKEQWEELKDDTKSIWTTRNGVNGRLFTANNGNSLFLPAAGYRWRDGFIGVGGYGRYWSSSFYAGNPSHAWGFNVYSGYYGKYYYYRYYGRSVRAVREN